MSSLRREFMGQLAKNDAFIDLLLAIRHWNALLILCTASI